MRPNDLLGIVTSVRAVLVVETVGNARRRRLGPLVVPSADALGVAIAMPDPERFDEPARDGRAASGQTGTVQFNGPVDDNSIIGLCGTRRCTTSNPSRSKVDATPLYSVESALCSSVSHG